jgi:SatD family (SatD)
MQWLYYCIENTIHDMIVLMADIIGSTKKKSKLLMTDFKTAIVDINKSDKKYILSPLTITLGDEFQGVVKDAYSAFHVMFDLELSLMRLKKPFKLRYVIQEGRIDTKLNRTRAYEMLGPGLTAARKHLNSMKSSKSRFRISLENALLTTQLSLAMNSYQGITDQWTIAQQKVVIAFLDEQLDYRKVASKLKKDPTTMWRRKRSLLIDEVNSLKKLIFLIINPKLK